MRPFGTDDDDIEMNYILDRHVQASFAMVDSVMEQSPPLIDDRFTKDQITLPHTKLSSKYRDHPPKLHAYVNVKTPEDGEIKLILEDNIPNSSDALKTDSGSKKR